MDASINETNFIVQRSATTTGPWTTLATLPSGSMTYSDPIGKTDSAYSYRVFASNTVGDTSTPGFPTTTVESKIAGPVTVGTTQIQPPAAPTNLAAVLQAGPQVLLTWRDNADNETEFAIERQIRAGAFSTLIMVGPRNATGNVSYTDTTVSPANAYTYRIAAVNAAGLSDYSNMASVTVIAPLQLRPT